MLTGGRLVHNVSHTHIHRNSKILYTRYDGRKNKLRAIHVNKFVQDKVWLWFVFLAPISCVTYPSGSWNLACLQLSLYTGDWEALRRCIMWEKRYLRAWFTIFLNVHSSRSRLKFFGINKRTHKAPQYIFWRWFYENMCRMHSMLTCHGI